MFNIFRFEILQLFHIIKLGTHSTFKMVDSEMWAVGWQDIHFKTYVSTCGKPYFFVL